MYQRVQLFFALVNVWGILFVQKCSAQDAGGCNISWNLQPIQDTLSCDPLGVDITLECNSFPVTLSVSWFWTQNVSQAGINGTQIIASMTPYIVTGFISGYKKLLFQVSESTVGYYWCEITDAGVDVRPSGIVPVCSNESLPQCPNPYETYPLNPHIECAIQASTFIVSHSGLPTDCTVPPSPSPILGPTTHNSFQTSPVLSITVLQLETTISPTSVDEFPVTVMSKSASSIAEFPVTVTSKSPSSIAEFYISVTQTVSQALVSCHSSNQPLISDNSLPWVLAIAGLGVALVIAVSMLVFFIIINCKQNKTIALLRTQTLDMSPITEKRLTNGPTRDITSSLRSITGTVPTEQNMAYAAFSSAAKDEKCIYEN